MLIGIYDDELSFGFPDFNMTITIVNFNCSEK